MPFTVLTGVRRGTLADVAPVARLAVDADREARRELPPLHDPAERGAPELALQLLEDLNDGSLLYVAERDGRTTGYAQVTGLMVGDGGHLVEVRRVYVVPEHRRRGTGRRLLALVVRDLRHRPGPPALRAWAPAGSDSARFLEAAGGSPVRQRWKVGHGGIAVKGVLFGWGPTETPAVRDHALA